MHIIMFFLAMVAGAGAVIGGTSSEVLPGVVKLQAGGRICTGTIVGPRAVLSAAHCANTKSPYFIYKGKTYRVRYVQSRRVNEGHDLALALTERDIVGAVPVKIVKKVRHGAKLLIAGYGCTRKGGIAGKLHIGMTRVIGMDRDHLLSSAKRGGVLCEGDSGGPAFIRKGDEFLLAAVNSLGDLQQYNVNVRVDSKWTEEFLKTYLR